jgi:hypothetical protein
MTEKLFLIEELWDIYAASKHKAPIAKKRESIMGSSSLPVIMAKPWALHTVSKKDREALQEIVDRNNEEVRALNMQLTESSNSKKLHRKSRPTFKGYQGKASNVNPKELKNIKEIRTENQTYFNQAEYVTYLVKKYSVLSGVYKGFMAEGEKRFEYMLSEMRDFKTVYQHGKTNMVVEDLEDKFGKYVQIREPAENEEYKILYASSEDEIIFVNFSLKVEFYFYFFSYYQSYDTLTSLE